MHKCLHLSRKQSEIYSDHFTISRKQTQLSIDTELRMKPVYVPQYRYQYMIAPSSSETTLNNIAKCTLINKNFQDMSEMMHEQIA